MISQSVGLLGLANSSVTHDSNSLVISECLGALPAVESMRQPRQQFVDYF